MDFQSVVATRLAKKLLRRAERLFLSSPPSALEKTSFVVKTSSEKSLEIEDKQYKRK
jgi:hypothetical protein